MTNTLFTRSLTITLLVLLVAAVLPSCAKQPQSIPLPPTREGEPILQISGAIALNTSPTLPSIANDTPRINSDDSDSSKTINTSPSKDIPTRRVKEGELVTFSNLKASDPDGDDITFTFSTPLNKDGEWQTKRGDAGKYRTTITASDGQTQTTQEILIIVESINNAPILRVQNVNVLEGEPVILSVNTTDADGDAVTLRFDGWMNTPRKETTSADIGTHRVTVSATDGFETTTQEITITITDVNFAPKLRLLNDMTVTEGEVVRIAASATDKDGDTLTYSFSEPFNERGEWITNTGDEGNYTIRVIVSDGKLTDSQDIDVIVLHKNSPPILTLAQDTISVEEGQTIRIQYTASDPEDDRITITFTGWMDRDTYTTTYDDAGEHTVTISATDGRERISKDVRIIVKDKNRPPVFDRNSLQ